MSEIKTFHRIDKFEVPENELQQFLSTVVASHRQIDGLEGCVRNEVMMKCQGEGRFNVVTHVVWEDQTAYDVAVEEMTLFHQRRGGRPEIPSSIKADRANYIPINFRKQT
ncbi:hypothetical protein [Sulfitobacter sp. 20_GPM-1509m]|uniref:hypothetical protein n=1 Tax=Sulfitobacter sp. 20_GPM-1509m TaxID=1380367 RepID=UPI000686E194|nr:hypothetical protein [Sulfitobacter sp. 20_GPM-1509m]